MLNGSLTYTILAADIANGGAEGCLFLSGNASLEWLMSTNNAVLSSVATDGVGTWKIIYIHQKILLSWFYAIHYIYEHN